MNSTAVLGVFLLIGILIVGYMMGIKIRKHKINFKYVYVNYVILFVFAILLGVLFFAPGVLDKMLKLTGFAAPTSLVFTFVLAFLFYTSFLQEIKIAKQNEQIEELARIISVDKALNRENENGKN
jgi:hypothetical protein